MKVYVSRERIVHIKCRGFIPGGLPYLTDGKGLLWLDVCDTINQGLNEDKLTNTRTFLRARR